jgi:uncharacterized protein YjiS (DUF1127 family)
MATCKTRFLILGTTTMNAPTAKGQFGFSLGNLTYIDSGYDGEAPLLIVGERKDGVDGWFSRRLNKFVEWRRRCAVMREMAMMTDHELSDIGLSRADVARVFDPTFAAERARSRNYITY